MIKTTLLRQKSFLPVNRTSGLLIWWYSFYLYDIRLFKWMLYEHLSLSNLSVSVICLWLLFTSFFAYHYVRSKWKRDNRLNIDTILRADTVSTLKFLIKGRTQTLISANLSPISIYYNPLSPSPKFAVFYKKTINDLISDSPVLQK